MQKSAFDDPFFFFVDQNKFDHRKRKYTLGIFFIVLVSFIWIVSSVASQYIYTEYEFDSPFLVTYIGVCLFALILPLKWCTDKIGCTRDTTCLANVVVLPSSMIPMNIDPTDISVMTDYYRDLDDSDNDHNKNNYNYNNNNKKNALNTNTNNTNSNINNADNNKKKQNHRRKNNNNNNTTKTALFSNDDDDNNNVNNNNSNNEKQSTSNCRTTSNNGSCNNSVSNSHNNNNANDDDGRTVVSTISTVFELNHPGPHWNHSKHIFVAMHIAPVLFIANWLFNASLQSTSVVSSTVLVSTSGMFCFVLAVLAKEETFHICKLAGVLLGILGSVLTARHDFNVQDEYDPYDDNDNYVACTTADCNYNLWGDTLAVLAAVAFGAYAVQVRLLCPVDEELYSMGLLLGYIGLIIMIPLLPVAAVLWTKVDMTYDVFIIILIRGLFDYCISEYLHFRAFVLTSATIATVGLGLTIPMAFIADYVMGKDNILSISSIAGAVAVSVGFLLVNLFDDHENHTQHHHNTITTEVAGSNNQNKNDDDNDDDSIPSTIIQPPKETKNNHYTYSNDNNNNNNNNEMNDSNDNSNSNYKSKVIV